MNPKRLLVRVGLAVAAGGMLLALALGAQPKPSPKPEAKDVYVCACMKTSSCPCAAMANKAGKCPCGDEMKAVPRDSKWAETNRKELAQ
jgi:hypothetical protein